MPNNLDLVPTSVNLFPQQLIATTTNNPLTIDAPVFVDPVGEFFRVLELKFPVKSFEKILQLATFSRQKNETLKMLYRRFLKLKEDTQSIIDLEVAHRYLRSLERTPTLHAKVLQWVFAEFGDSYTLFDVYNIFENLKLVHAHYEASTMRPPSHSRSQPPPLRQPDHHILFQGLKWCTRLQPFYLLITTMVILPTKLVSVMFLLRISFVSIVGKKNIMKLFVLPSSWNENNSDYNGKIC
jgi:hypothetical protein